MTPDPNPEELPEETMDRVPAGLLGNTGATRPPPRPSSGEYALPPASQPTGGYAQPPAHPTGGYAQPPTRPTGGYAQPPARPTGGYAQPPARPTGGYAQPPARPTGGYPPPPAGPAPTPPSGAYPSATAPTGAYAGPPPTPRPPGAYGDGTTQFGGAPPSGAYDATQTVEAELVSEAPTHGDPDATIAEMAPAPARRQLGDFELERKVGQGGMGEVWLARQVSLDRPVAVKILPRSLATQDNFLERFQREARAAASLVHPNVLQVYGFGIEDQEKTPYFAMEFVEGEDLQQRLRRVDHIEFREVVAIMEGVASALEVAHDKGIVHRDIKPSNIMINKQGIVKVMDFGLAKATQAGEESKNLTNAGLIMGTPNYLSPEQGRGDPLDGRSDLYSLGIVLYECLTGRIPFTADTPAGLIFKHVYEPPPPPLELRPELPPFLVEITLKLLEKDPEDRYAGGKQLLADLAEFSENFDHYVETRAERRPGSGYQDTERMEATSISGAVSGSLRPNVQRSTSSRRNAVTEEVTSPIEKREATPAAGHESTQTVIIQAPPSRTPMVVLVLLLVLGAGFGYAWMNHREQVLALAERAGLYTPPPTPVPTPPPSEDVAFIYTGTWVDGVSIQLKAPKHTMELEKGSTLKYPPGQYRLIFTRRGYETVEWSVRLVRAEGNKGRLLDPQGRDAATVAVDWAAGSELSEAYTQARKALSDDQLDVAERALGKAADYDPAYRPDDLSPSVAELRQTLDERQGEAKRQADRLKDLLALSQQHMQAKRWRTALQNLESLPAEEQPDTWKARVDQCRSEISRGDEVLGAMQGAIARGDHDEATTKLIALIDTDPEHPERAAIEQRLKNAKTLRQEALAGDDGLAAVARLETYVTNFGTEDREAKARLAELQAGQATQAAQGRQEAELQAAIDAKDWPLVERLAAKVLERFPASTLAQEAQGQATQALAEAAIAEVIGQLDAALTAGDPAQLARLLDPRSPAYEEEGRALRRLRRVEGRFLSSEHRELEVRVDGAQAELKATWLFGLRVLGQRSQRFIAQHVIQLRLSDERWLVTRLEVDGGVRVQR